MTIRPDLTPFATRRTVLRSRTAGAHADVERAAGGAASLAAYRTYLLGLDAFRAPVEARLASVPWPVFLGGWRPTLIGADLRRDMADLSLSPVPCTPAEFPTPRDAGGWMGLLYVIEGSSLGARSIVREGRRLGLSENFGARHLALQAGASGNWRAFLTLLEAIEPFDQEQAAGAAIETFRLAEQAFGMARA